MKRVIQFLLLFFALVTGCGAYFKTELTQLYHTVRLFDEDVIVSNFSNMQKIAPTKTVKRSGDVSKFGQQHRLLPPYFSYNGKYVETDRWLKETNTTAMIVLKANDISYEEYYLGTGEFDYRISWSVAKSFLSAIFGIAVDEGVIADLDTPVTDFVPELIGSGYEGVSIKNVLQMSSGIYFNEDYGDFFSDINRMGRILALGGSFDEFATTLTRYHEQGTYMHYVSIDTHVLGMVLRAATGREFVDYFNEKLWSKLKTERDAIYITDSVGEPMVLGGLNLISRDYLRLGKLYRDDGSLDGKQIIPAHWIEESITPDAPHLIPGPRNNAKTHFGYGYQWWIPENADEEFMAIGIYGQYIYINRKADVVIVKNSADLRFMENNYESMDYAVAAFRGIAYSVAENATTN
ncbi:serine hydrolase [uncultured Photobacterium sp.]|uniref:serine hydrolase domain-containing protein n=1 Tax=uncultured Photobacterium sp. TaxID=173973 RepID=UPI00261487B2|nr:serine hydrolase [uncultured Photobacterium sp.]